jgi:hypothetical protein
MSNFVPEFVSDDELLVLAEFYTKKIADVDSELRRLDDAHQTYEYKVLRKEKFRLMQRRYYLRICHRHRTTRHYT